MAIYNCSSLNNRPVKTFPLIRAPIDIRLVSLYSLPIEKREENKSVRKRCSGAVKMIPQTPDQRDSDGGNRHAEENQDNPEGADTQVASRT